jgi:hypothetical protein
MDRELPLDVAALLGGNQVFRTRETDTSMIVLPHRVGSGAV